MVDLVTRAQAAFEKTYGRAARYIVAAPGRVNLLGEHTDYNGGFVLPMAIERHVVIAADLRTDSRRHVNLSSSATKAPASFVLGPNLQPGNPPWANYVKGVIAGFVERGVTIPGFDAAIENSVPLGGGLSSSAALEVATATLLEAITGRTLDPLDKPKLCQTAEHAFAGMPCGLMDQYIVTLGEAGSALLIDCERETSRAVPLDAERVAVLVINSHVRHTLVGSPYVDRRNQCHAAALLMGVPNLRAATPHRVEAFRARMDDVVYRRARHVTTENQRTLDFAEALAAGDDRAAGRLMFEGHASQQHDFEISCPQLDLLVALARDCGDAVFGSRMTGGGFGGCTVSLVRPERATAVAQHIATRYHQQTGLLADWFVTQAAAGAAVIESPIVVPHGKAAELLAN